MVIGTRKFETAAELEGDVRAGVIDLLYRLADDELVMGHRNSEWTGLGPILEADIAFSSMAQDEMGHALAYYNLLHGLGEPDADSLVFKRVAAEFRCCAFVAVGASEFEGARDASVSSGELRVASNELGRERNAEGGTMNAEGGGSDRGTHVARVGGDWAFSLVRQYLYDAAEHERLLALCESSYRPVAGVARKLVAEEKYHVMHGRTWIGKLGAATEESHLRLQAALTAAMPLALGVFEATRFDGVLAENGVCPRETELCERWLAVIRRELSEAGLTIEEPLPQPVYGGRFGKHPAELGELVEGMQRVNRIDPGANW